jgi:hypothetical protein
VTCPYCGLISKITSGALDPSGKFARLTPSRSKLHVGFSFNVNDEQFTVLGRIRYQYDEGYWDEWWVSSNKRSAWLEEDEGSLMLYAVQKITSKIPPLEQIQVGSTIAVNGKEFFVTEKNTAKVVGSEGEMSEVYLPDAAVSIVDGAFDGQTGSIEYWSDEISFSTATEIQI